MNLTIITSFLFFVVLSLGSLFLSDAPAKVHAVNIACFFVAFFLGTVVAEKRPSDLPTYIIWLVAGLLGLFAWDVVSSLVIVKAGVFMGWYIIYPVGLLGILCLQIMARAASKFGPFNKKRQGDA
ncbi:hypothetical protein BTJ40_16420 [Microbulbifer sp. A4B17]|uniref:hypothetical protein n=1 Tax=Microbulbifer sp. A4B17 TaxID=359370 RepID=UPI000D52AAC4|nr:hypothetical protein [Microbulbifer sp. A4B17]AWF82283.1 hypothetical protein BTJ40_16420 [Microbulbifer sp. A4B17]